MGDQDGSSAGTSMKFIREDEEDDFCSCCEHDDDDDDDEHYEDEDDDDDEHHEDEDDDDDDDDNEKFCRENDEPARKIKYDLDEFSVNMYFKGLSISGDAFTGFSGIGVVMERSTSLSAIQVQKKLDFFVDESVAEYLALMDGLSEAIQNKIHHVHAFTDSKLLYDQIALERKLEIPILAALRERVFEHASSLDSFMLMLVPSAKLERPLQLAQVAIGIVTSPVKGNKVLENCSICCQDKPSPMMMKMKCAHKFCSHCLRTYVDERVQSSQVPIRCPHLGCKYLISTVECKCFLPIVSHVCFEKALEEANILHLDKIYCPFPNCAVLLDPNECLSSRASSSSQSDNSCIECPVCQRFICVECGVPWHSSFSCEEYQSLPLEERDSADVSLHQLACNERWRRCQQCHRMIELNQGCYHMTCRCGHEFCYSCGAEYRDEQKTCRCVFWDENNSDDSVAHSVQESEQWAWETFNSLPMIMEAYSDQERSQLALIQRFLAGGFSVSDHNPYQSPPRCTDSSYKDAIKDLQQLPWLERFVSVISDNYYDDFIE